MDREQMTMRKCVSSAPDQPRLILAEKRMLMGRQRDKLYFPQALGLDKPWVAQNSGVLLDSFFTGPEVGTCQQVHGQTESALGEGGGREGDGPLQQGGNLIPTLACSCWS